MGINIIAAFDSHCQSYTVYATLIEEESQNNFCFGYKFDIDTESITKRAYFDLIKCNLTQRNISETERGSIALLINRFKKNL